MRLGECGVQPQGMKRSGLRLAERVAGGKEAAVAELDVGG